MASSATGHRQSQLPSTRRPISPKEDWPSGWSSPGLTSEEAGPGAIRRPLIRGRDTQRPASLREEVLRPPDAVCRLLVGVRMDPSGLSESALPPKQQDRLSLTELTIRKLAASSARLIGAYGLSRADGQERHHRAEAWWNQPDRKPGQYRSSQS